MPENCKLYEKPKILIPGYAHGLSNGKLNEWTKVLNGRDQFQTHLKQLEKAADEVPSEELPKLMQAYSQVIQERVMSDTTLQSGKNVQRTDTSYSLEKALSGVFCTNQWNNFATVSTTVLMVHSSGTCSVSEFSYTHRHRYLTYLLGTCMRRLYSVSNRATYTFKMNVDKVQPKVM